MTSHIAAHQHEMVWEAVQDILKYAHRHDFLRPRKWSKPAAIDTGGREMFKKVVEQMAKTFLAAQKESTDQLAQVLAVGMNHHTPPSTTPHPPSPPPHHQELSRMISATDVKNWYTLPEIAM